MNNVLRSVGKKRPRWQCADVLASSGPSVAPIAYAVTSTPSSLAAQQHAAAALVQRDKCAAVLQISLQLTACSQAALPIV